MRVRAPAVRVLALLACLTSGLAAQQDTGVIAPGGIRVDAPPANAPAAVHRVEGQVVTPIGERPAPKAGVMVTLHRVGRDTAGPLDSMRTGADGRYRFRFKPFGASDALYFVSASHDGIAYFSAPLREDVVSGEEAEITVFDTTTRALGLTVRGRHLVVSAAGLGDAKDATTERSVVEIFELSNDSSRTMVAGKGGGEHATWTSPLPEGAHDFKVGQGDVSPDAVSFSNGRVLVFAPMAPGLKQVSFSYRLPATAFPLSVPIEKATQVFEVLLEDPRASAGGIGMKAQDPVSLEGRTFRRWLAQDVAPGGVLRVEFPATATESSRLLWIVGVALAVGVAMLIGLARAFTRRAAATVVPRLGDDDPDDIARRIAALDADFERTGAKDDDERAAYAQQRARLKERLAVALDRGALRR